MSRWDGIRSIKHVGVAVGFLILFANCEQLFEVGLGDKVDIEPPVVDILSHVNGQYVTGVQQLGGSFGDDSDVAALQLSADGGKTFSDIPFDPAGDHWLVEIDTVGFGDGEQDIRVRIEDATAKIAEKKLLLYFDNHGATWAAL